MWYCFSVSLIEIAYSMVLVLVLVLVCVCVGLLFGGEYQDVSDDKCDAKQTSGEENNNGPGEVSHTNCFLFEQTNL